MARHTCLRAAVTALALCGLGAACQGGTGEGAAPRVDEVFARFRSSAAPGVGVLAVRDGRTLFERGYGVTDLRTKRAIGGEANFRLASVSKQFTAIAIMLLAHDRRLAYDACLTDVLPGFPEYGKAITIRHLLRHTSLGEVEMREALVPAVVRGPAAVGPDGRPVSYGFGWFLNPHHGHDRMWHHGETVGFRTTIQRFPRAGLTVVVLANRPDLVPAEYALTVADLLLR